MDSVIGDDKSSLSSFCIYNCRIQNCTSSCMLHIYNELWTSFCVIEVNVVWDLDTGLSVRHSAESSVVNADWCTSNCLHLLFHWSFQCVKFGAHWCLFLTVRHAIASHKELAAKKWQQGVSRHLVRSKTRIVLYRALQLCPLLGCSFGHGLWKRFAHR